MRRLSSLLVVAACTVAAAAPSSASAQATAPQCTDAGFEAFQCGTVQVPLDRTGAVGGAIDLFVRRLPTPAGGAKTALVALAGGPGQSATPAAASFASALATGLDKRDLIVFDQRGTGRSARLQCGSLAGSAASTSAIARCAQEIGPARGSFRTADSVEDLEAIRRQIGYDKLAFYGVSYGTKVALDYAARYPGNVESLVLDSVVPPEGPDPLQRSSFRRVRPVLSELCASGRCKGISSSTARDIRTLVKRGRALRGTVVSSGGRKSALRVAPETIYDILVSGDLNPAWRAYFPAAVRAAVRGDGTPLVRLGVASLGGGGSAAAGLQQQREDAGVNSTLYLATLCEEGRLPWARTTTTVSGRAREASAALAREPGTTWTPFSRKTAAGSGFLAQCLGWPTQSPPPAAPGALPAVPTLILNGTADLRTPLPDAQAVAGRIGGAQLVAVPNVGHSVLGLDPSGCAKAAIAGFYNGQGVAPCPASRPLAPPTAVPARSVSSLGTTGRLRGRVGRTMTAVLRTQQDVAVRALGEDIQGTRSKWGGLRGGTVTMTDAALTLRNVVVVPGVSVSGTLPAEGTTSLRVRGSRGAASGSLSITSAGVITGRLGGQRIRLVPRARSAAVAQRGRVPYPALVRAAG